MKNLHDFTSTSDIIPQIQCRMTHLNFVLVCKNISNMEKFTYIFIIPHVKAMYAEYLTRYIVIYRCVMHLLQEKKQNVFFYFLDYISLFLITLYAPFKSNYLVVP